MWIENTRKVIGSYVNTSSNSSGDMSRIGKSIIGIYLVALSAVMLFTVIRTIPDGAVIYINNYGEYWFDIALLSIGLILGLGLVVWQIMMLWRRR